jgi:hypothetical protein
MRRFMAWVILALSVCAQAAHAEPSPLEGRWSRPGARDAIVRLTFTPNGRFQLRSVSRELPDQLNLIVRGAWRQVNAREYEIREDGDKTWQRVRFRVVENGTALVTEEVNPEGTALGAKHRYQRR